MRRGAALAAALACALAWAGATGCAPAPVSPDAPVLRVVTGLFPLDQAIAQIGQGKVAVEDLVPPGADPRTYQLTTSAVAAVRSAGLVVEVGGGFQPSFEAAAALRSGRTLSLAAAGGAEGAGLWLDPEAMVSAVAAIARAMEAADPAAARLFRDGAEGFAAEVRSTGIDYRSTLSTCPRRQIFTADSAFSTVASRYGLQDRPLGAGGAPDRGEVARLASQVVAAGASTVFAETWVPTATVTAVAAAAHVHVATLDTLTGRPPGGWPAGATYPALMEANLGRLSAALGCPGAGPGT